MLSATLIILLDGPRVGSPESLASLVVMKRIVAPVSKTTMAIRASYMIPSRCGVSCVL